jgi:phosphoribosylglycinamide formyltransferase 2
MKHKTWPKKVTEALGGAGLFEWNSWLMMGFTFQNSPRPDTGMVTLAGNFNEFELHLRAILSLPILKLH